MNNKIDLTKVNKTKKISKTNKVKKIITGPSSKLTKKHAGPRRDKNGKFISNSGALKSIKNLNFKRAIPLVLAVAMVGGFMVYRSFAATTLHGNDGEFVSIRSTRLYDSRNTGRRAPLSAGQTVQIPVHGRAGVPVTARAVVVNVTVVGPTASSSAHIWSGTGAKPQPSQILFHRDKNIANELLVPIGSNGNIQMQHGNGSAHYVYDVGGYIGGETSPNGLRLSVINSTRLYDSRSSGSRTPLRAGQAAQIPVHGRAGVPVAARAVVANVTAINPSAVGSTRVWAGDSAMPDTTQLAFHAGQNISNELIVPIGSNGNIQIWNSTGNTHYTIDISGYYTSETSGQSTSQVGRYVPVNGSAQGTRRSGLKTDGAPASSPVGPNETRQISILRGTGVPETAQAVVVNVVSMSPSVNTNVRVWAGNRAMPSSNQLNVTRGQAIANELIIPIGENGNIQVWNSNGNNHFVFDVSGYITGQGSGAGSTPALDTIRIATLGDSNTADRNWRNVFQDNMRAANCSYDMVGQFGAGPWHAPGYDWDTDAKGGAGIGNSNSGLNIFRLGDATVNTRPEMIYIIAGTNNVSWGEQLWNGDTMDMVLLRVINNLENDIRNITTSSPNSLILLGSIPHSTLAPNFVARYNVLQNELVTKLRGEQKNIIYWDARTTAGDVQSDGVHLAASGVTKYGNAAFAAGQQFMTNSGACN